MKQAISLVVIVREIREYQRIRDKCRHRKYKEKEHSEVTNKAVSPKRLDSNSTTLCWFEMETSSSKNEEIDLITTILTDQIKAG